MIRKAILATSLLLFAGSIIFTTWCVLNNSPDIKIQFTCGVCAMLVGIIGIVETLER